MRRHELETPKVIRVTDFSWHDRDSDWQPDDPHDLIEWAAVDVGDERGSVCYQVHICTHTAMHLLENKRHVFSIDSYSDLTDLILKLDTFIAEKTDHFAGDPFRELARFWKSEYGAYDDRGNLIE